MTDAERSVVGAESGVASVEVEHLGGIDRCALSFDPGGTILEGRNATNRTSLLSAIGGALGGSTATVKSDAETGRVSLDVGDERYTREYSRTASGLRADGSPYTDDATLVDSFVALLEDNPARLAVERGDDLREVLMRPVDTEAIEAHIDDLRRQLRELSAERERVEGRRAGLPGLEEQRRTLVTALDEIEAELGTQRESVAEFEADAGVTESANELVEALDRRRRALKERENALEVARAERAALETDEDEIESSLESLSEIEGADVDSVEADLAAARERKRAIDEAITALTTIVEFNDGLLSEGSALPGVETAADVTEALAPEGDHEVVCWTCGSQVNRDAIAGRLDDLRELAGEKRDERSTCQDEIDAIEARRRELVESADRRESLSARLTTTREQIEDRERRLEALESEIEDLRAELVELEDDAAHAEALRESDVMDTYEQISDLEYERGQRRQQLDSVESEIAEVEALPEADEFDERRAELREELERDRGRIEELETTAVSAFNDHMDELLSILEYGNVERVWIERKTADGEAESTFDLHVVRESDDAGYEDVVDHLSESEREVIGLVVALSGYLVHEVYETVPFILLDSLEAIDAERIAALVEYFADFAPYLLVALLPEDAAAVDPAHGRVTAEALN